MGLGSGGAKLPRRSTRNDCGQARLRRGRLNRRGCFPQRRRRNCGRSPPPPESCPMADIRPLAIRDEDLPSAGWDDPIKGRVDWRTLFSADVTPTNGLTAGVADLAPGDWLGLHRHRPAEIYYVIEG